MLDGCEAHDRRRYNVLPLAVTMSVEAREKGLVINIHHQAGYSRCEMIDEVIKN
jgi:hypothetical protein